VGLFRTVRPKSLFVPYLVGIHVSQHPYPRGSEEITSQVHCHRGISRSCTLVIAYLIWGHRHTLDEAFTRVRQLRPMCDPNLNYLCSLQEWESHVFGHAVPAPPLPTRTRSGSAKAQPLQDSSTLQTEGQLDA